MIVIMECQGPLVLVCSTTFSFYHLLDDIHNFLLCLLLFFLFYFQFLRHSKEVVYLETTSPQDMPQKPILTWTTTSYFFFAPPMGISAVSSFFISWLISAYFPVSNHDDDVSCSCFTIFHFCMSSCHHIIGYVTCIINVT